MTKLLPATVKSEMRRDATVRVLWSVFALGLSGFVLYNLVAAACTGQWLFVLVYAVYTVLVVLRIVPALAYQFLDARESTYLLNRQYGMADAFMRRAIQLYSRMPGSRSRYLPVLNSHHLRIKMYLADYDSAESIARASLKEAVGDRAQQGNIALYRANLGAPLIAQNRTEEALDELQQAAQQLELHPASAPLIKPYLELGLGSVYFFSDDSQSIEKMEAHMRSARSMFEHMRTPRGFKQLWKREALAICDLALAKASAAKGDMPQADQFSNQFFQNLEQDPRILTPTLLRRINKVAQLYIDHKHFAQSERLLNVAYQIGHDAPNHPDAARTLDCFEKLLLLTDRQAEVPDMRKWLRIDYQLLAP